MPIKGRGDQTTGTIGFLEQVLSGKAEFAGPRCCSWERGIAKLEFCYWKHVTIQGHVDFIRMYRISG